LTSKSDTQRKTFIEKVAKKTGSTFDQVAGLIKTLEQYQEAEAALRRPTEDEKTLLRAELDKLDVRTLRHLNSRVIAAKLASQGLPIRPKAQGVLSFISRTRRQLLLIKGADNA
jgi:hypothetical protein